MNQSNPTPLFVGSAASSAILPAALLASVLVFTACGGGSGGVADTTQPPASPMALQASAPGALLGYIQGKLSAQVDKGQDFLSYNGFYRGGEMVDFATVTTTSAEAGGKSFASTTLQEGGVEEADLMKTDGSRVYSLSVDTPGSWRLNTLRVDRRLSDGSLQADGSLALGGTDSIEGLHVAARGERVALLGQSEQWYTLAGLTTQARTLDATFAPTPMTPPQTVVGLVDVKSGQKLNQTHSIRIDGQMVDNRMIGDTLYVVTSWYPRLDVVPLASSATPVERKSAISRLSNRDLLPTVTVTRLGSTATSLTEPLMADTDCYLQTQNASAGVQMTTITAFNLASPNLERASRCFLGGTEAFYLSATNLYLATSRYESVDKGGVNAYPGQVNTDIHKFAINGMRINYRGSGEVTGHLGWDSNKTSYRLSEHKGDLRVITYTNQFGWFGEPGTANATSKPSPAILTVLREDGTGAKLQTIGSLPNSKRPAPIGLSGEQIYAVRFLGDRGYVVTFRRTDPLYILDLTDPTDPKVTGELKTNGYSDYLLAAGEGLLLGVGKDANAEGRVQGVKVSLFDVANASAPKEIATRVIGKTGSASALDYSRHGINLMSVAGVTRIALPVTVNDTPDPFSAGWFRPSYQGLARFEVNAASKTLTDRPLLTGQTFPNSGDPAGYAQGWLGHERSVQIDSHVYYLTGQGKLISSTW